MANEGQDSPRMSAPLAASLSMNYQEFQAARYFPELDGLRALSILLVISIHTTDPLWAPLHGNVGVTIFFVISGFVITTLLLREEDKRGRVRIRAFYARRAFRILPVYCLVLLAYILLIGVLKLQPGANDLWKALPYFATYQWRSCPGPVDSSMMT
jgi:peptidoglycan/LPS O-acetylase OafA/YrhL